MENKKNKINWLKAYAILATLGSGFLTAHVMFGVLEEALGDIVAWVIGGLTAVLLDVGLFIWDSRIPEAKTDEQRNLYISMVRIFWVLMLITSVSDGFISAYSSARYSAGFWQGVSIFVVSGIGNIVIGAYLLNNIYDPDHKQKVANNSAKIERAKKKSAALAEFEKNNGYIIAGIEFIEEQRAEYIAAHGRPMPEILQKALIKETGISREILLEFGVVAERAEIPKA